MNIIKLTIDGQEIESAKGVTILAAAKSIGIKIPSLCYMKMSDIDFKNDCASCRVCVVEVEGRRNLAPACSTSVAENMVVLTNTARVINSRKTIVELLLSDHPKDCLICIKNRECELQTLSQTLGIRKIKYQGRESKYRKEISPSIVRDTDKCIMCKRCENMCTHIQTVGALSGIHRGFEAAVATSFEQNLETTVCTNCGQCVAVCPVGALYETDYTEELIKDIENPEKIVIVQVAPAVRVALGEEFGYSAGSDVTEEMVASLKKIGFNKVFDTNFAADLTIMEEASELKERLEKYLAGDKNVKLPLITSCCPSWVKFCEHNYHDMLGNLSSAKSPQQMFGAIAKNVWAKEMKIKRKDLVVVSIMPCLAKKYEAGREEFSFEGNPDVDYSISTRQLANLLKQFNIDLKKMKKEKFDNPLGYSTGAGNIFGRTGGVMEAALRTVHEWITGEELENVDFGVLRGLHGIKTATIEINGIKLRVGIANGLGSARELMERVRSGEEQFHAIEIMACKGGCIGGGGQPYHHGDFRVIKERQHTIQMIDESKSIRKSHCNPYVIEIYDKYLVKPLSNEAHYFLHTRYEAKKNV